MEPKQFIEKAIEGGWDYVSSPSLLRIENLKKDIDRISKESYSLSQIFLDPKAWEAVGKVEGWNRKAKLEIAFDKPRRFIYKRAGYEYEWYMHVMIDHLVSGGTIETYLKTL